MKNSTFTNFSYNSPMKPSKDESQPYQQDGMKNISMTPNIKTDYTNLKQGDSLADSRVQRVEEQSKTQKIQINRKHNSLYQEEDQGAQILRHTNASETALGQSQQQINAMRITSGPVTESPFKTRSKKASSQHVNASCLPNIFQDQEEYNFMRQQQQAILGGLMIDGKLHPNGNPYKQNTNLDSNRMHQQSVSQNNNGYTKKKNQIRIRSSQHQDSSQQLINEEYNINNKQLNYRIDNRQAKSNDQRYTNSLKKAIKVSLNKNPALAASLEIYTNGNQSSIQQMSKVVQPYLMNQFLQKRKNLLQKKVNIHHSTATKRSQNQSLQQRQYQNNQINNNNNNSFNTFNNKSQILDESGYINSSNNSQLQKLMQVSNNNQTTNLSSSKQNNIQSSNIVINKSINSKPANLNALLSEYRTNSGGQRLLLQDFYNQQGIKDPDFSQKQQSLIDQYNYSKPSLNDKASNSTNKQTSTTSQSNAIASQSVKDSSKENEKKKITIDQEKEKKDNPLSEESISNVSYVQTYNNNAYGVFQDNDGIDQSYSSNLTQSISSHRKQYVNNISHSGIALQKNANSIEQGSSEDNQNYIEVQAVLLKEQEQSTQKSNIAINSNTVGEHINININTNSSPRSKRISTNNHATSPVIDLSGIPIVQSNNKSADETLSPIKNSRADKNQSIIHQRIVFQQQKRRGNSFNHTRGGGTFSIGGSGDPSYDLSIVNGVNNNLNNQANLKQFDFYESKSSYQQNMFSPPRIHKSKAVYVQSSTLNQAEINKQSNRLETNEEEYTFLNEEMQSEKRSPSNPRTFISSIPNDQILLIKSHIPEQPIQQQQQQNLEIKSNIITSNIQNGQKLADSTYTCYFLKGNNSGLVRRVLLTRSNWKESPVYSSNLNFRWHPFSRGIKFESLSIHKKRIVNHFEFHAEITTKNGIIKNIGKYCSERGLNIFDFTPSTFLFSLKDKFWDLDLIRFGDFFYKNLPEPLRGLNDYKKNVIEIKSKFRQIQIRSIQPKSSKKKQPSPLGPSVDKYGEMKIHSTFLGDDQNSYMWLLKPTNLNRGRGIELFSNLHQLESLLNNYFDGFYEQPITNKVQNNEEKQTPQQQQDMLLDIAMAESIAAKNVLIENITPNDEKEKEEPTLKNLFDKSLYQTPTIADKTDEKGKQVEVIRKNSNNQNKNNKSPKNLGKNKEVSIDDNKPSDTNNSPIIAIKAQDQSQDQNNSDKSSGEEQLKEQDSPKKNDESENETKTKKQKIKKNKASTSNHNVNYNNNIHMARVRDLSLPKKPTVITSNTSNSNQNKQPNSPDKKGKNSNGISAEYGGYLMKEHSFVIQKYIEKPFLINERKFDIRMWVLVNQNLDVYLFKEGYIRTSSKKYDISDQENIFIHLTNNAIQKYSDTYGQFENGNQLSLDNFDEYLKLKGYKQTFRGDIMPRIKEIITISLLSVKNKLNANDRKYSFELFGYDFFIDQQFNVWLIEINTNPCIEESSPLLGMLIPRMIDDALKLSVDLIFPPQYSDEIIQKQHQKYNINKDKRQNSDGSPTGGEASSGANQFYQKKCLIESLFPVTGYSSQENMFQFLVNLYKSN